MGMKQNLLSVVIVELENVGGDGRAKAKANPEDVLTNAPALSNYCSFPKNL